MGRKRGFDIYGKGESGLCYFGEVGIVPGFSKHSLRDLIDEAKAWVSGRIKRYKFIKPALSCLRSKLWNQDLNNQSEVKYAKMFYDFGEIKQPNLTIKKKIGLEDYKNRNKKIISWFDKMPVSTRIDANESLNQEQLLRWVDVLYETQNSILLNSPCPVSR